MMIRTLLSFMVLFPVVASAQYDLQFFLQSAYTNDPQLNESRNVAKSSELEQQLIDAEHSLPHLSVSANYLFSPYFNNGGQLISANPGPDAIGYDIGITNGGLYSAQVNAEKNILNGTVINALHHQASAAGESALNDIAVQKHQLEKEVTDQYLTALLSLRLYRLEQNAVVYLTEEKSIADQLFSRGLVKQTDLLLLNIEIDNRRVELSNRHTMYRSDLNTLYTFCGIQDTAEVSLDSVALSARTEQGGTHFEKKFELDSVAASNMQIVSESKYAPQISLFFNTGLNAVELTGIQRKFGFSAGINVSYPLYDGGQRSITRQQNSLTLQSLSVYRNRTRLQVENRRTIALSRMHVQKTNLENMQQQMKQYGKVLDISEQELKQGLISVVDYLTLLRNYIDLQKNLATTEFEYQSEINTYNYWNW